MTRISELKEERLTNNFLNKVSYAMKTFLHDGGDTQLMVDMLLVLSEETDPIQIGLINRSTWQRLKQIDPAREDSVDHTRKF